MAKPNYGFQKRQKELDRKKKQEEKQLRKQQEKEGAVDESAVESGSDAEGGSASA